MSREEPRFRIIDSHNNFNSSGDSPGAMALVAERLCNRRFEMALEPGTNRHGRLQLRGQRIAHPRLRGV